MVGAGGALLALLGAPAVALPVLMASVVVLRTGRGGGGRRAARAGR